MKFTEFLNKYGFKKYDYIKVIGTRYYNITKNGSLLLADYLRTLRKIDGYRITASHFNCNLPYTIYYLVDRDNNVYRSDEFPTYITGTMKEIIKDLQDIVNKVKE